MGRRGPAPEPTALKLLKGNPGKRAINHDEPVLPAADVKPPKALKGRALAVWKDLATVLTTAGLLKASDWPVFRVWCKLVAETEAWERKVERVGAESATKLGYVKNLRESRKQLREYSGILGLTPSARSAIRVVPPAQPADTTADFLFSAAKHG